MLFPGCDCCCGCDALPDPLPSADFTDAFSSGTGGYTETDCGSRTPNFAEVSGRLRLQDSVNNPLGDDGSRHQSFSMPATGDCLYMAVECDVYSWDYGGGVNTSTVGVFIGGDAVEGGVSFVGRPKVGDYNSRAGVDSTGCADASLSANLFGTWSEGDTLLLEIEAIECDPSVLFEVRCSVNGTVEDTYQVAQDLTDFPAAEKKFVPTTDANTNIGVTAGDGAEWDNLSIWVFEK